MTMLKVYFLVATVLGACYILYDLTRLLIGCYHDHAWRDVALVGAMVMVLLGFIALSVG